MKYCSNFHMNDDGFHSDMLQDSSENSKKKIKNVKINWKNTIFIIESKKYENFGIINMI